MKTEWRQHTEYGSRVEILVTYEIHNNYFAMTRHTRTLRGRDLSFGTFGPALAEVFPEIAPFNKWHLVDIKTGPMHYIENAIYWAEFMLGVSKWNPRPGDPNYRECFESVVVFGALPGDTIPDLSFMPHDDLGDADGADTIKGKRAMVRARVTEWCAARLPALMEAFHADMRRLGLLPSEGLL